MPSFMSSQDVVNILVLGAGWTSKFLVPHFESEGFTFALTTRTGRPHPSCVGRYDDSLIIPFHFIPEPSQTDDDHDGEAHDDEVQYTRLPTARTAIITFPLTGEGQAKKLVETYKRTHAGDVLTNWIQLGSTSIYKAPQLHDHNSDYERTPRGIAEDELLRLGGAVLNLAGLWGGERVPMNWAVKVANTKEKLQAKTSLHLIHGADVARACGAMHRRFYGSERWIVTDTLVYDWWNLIQHWAEDLEKQPGPGGEKLEFGKWLAQCKAEDGVVTLPREQAKLGRLLDSEFFWKKVGVRPTRSMMDMGEVVVPE